MGLIFEYEEGQTPLAEEEKGGLLLPSITNHEDLDEFEQLNIEKALLWLMSKKFKKEKILTEDFVIALHKKMFDGVWRWAGTFRKSEKNIGVSWINIRTDLKVVLDDTAFWIDNATFPPDEIAIRFKHRLVAIHCFANGNGRHSRIMADAIIELIFKKEVFSWNHSNMVKADETRKKYISAIRTADNGNIQPLLKFARS